MIPAALALLIALPLRAQEADHESFYVHGWSQGCSVSIAHYGFPKLGEAIQDIPMYANIGIVSIAAGHEGQTVKWVYATENQAQWDAEAAAKAKAGLAKLGYAHPGYMEALRPDPVVDKRDLPRLINSTDTFRTRSPGPWPGRDWRLSSVYYDKLGDCGLLVYTKRDAKDLFQAVLARFGNPGARDDRALSHVTNGLLLLQDGDEQGALAETEIAATMAPQSALARYHHAALLKLTGHMKEAVSELKAAIALDSSYGAKWQGDPDFGPMNGFPDFAQLMRAGFGERGHDDQ